MKDIYSEVTDRIIEQLEAGFIPWSKPWTGISDGAISRATGRAYSLINQMLLNRPGEYVTFKQCKDEGGHVKKGAKSKFVVFWKVYRREKKDSGGAVIKDADGKPVMESIPVLRYFNVFHIDDCEGITAKYPNGARNTAHIDGDADSVLHGYVDREGIDLEIKQSDRAYYSPSFDRIVLPRVDQFDNTSEFYSTAFHEATHSTGHKSRLNRFTGEAANAAFGSETYSKEELVAEIGAACILHELNMETSDSFRNSAAYIQSWLKVLKNDKRMIISAASRAEKAVKLILNINDSSTEEAA